MGRGRDGHGGERGAARAGARWGMAARQGRAAMSDARAPFHYAETDSNRCYVAGQFYRMGGITGWELRPDVPALAVLFLKKNWLYLLHKLYIFV